MRVSAADFTDVALEVLNIDRVKADDGCVEANVGFSQPVAKVEGSA